MKEKICVERLRFFCHSCKKEAIIHWLTFFSAEEISKVKGLNQPKHCPWCGAEHQGDIEWDEKSSK